MTFRDFFRALWDRDPFPWQEDLAARVMQGEWPRVGLPTASGKTALIDIAVYALAMRAPGAARRIFFVVDRRVIVDEAAERAACIREKLRDAKPGSELGGLAKALRDLGGELPLETAVLRGAIPPENSWARSPLQPVVVCSTVDQIGSSLLFRAYGTSDYARPIRAGLAANDSIILLDEAHTCRAFASTLDIVRRYRKWADTPLDLPFAVVEMSATPTGDALRESAADLENEVLRRRWGASKKTRLLSVDPMDGEESGKGGFTALALALAREARGLRDDRGARVIGVIANRVRTARRVHDHLTNDEGCDAILLTGRCRPYDRDRIWEEWKGKIALGRETEPERPVFVVATQSIEVGANLDFDGLVTEVASMDALEQRFGRLDRDGKCAEKRGATHAVIVAQKDQTSKKFVDILYGVAMQATWSWLQEHMATETRVEEVPGEGKKKPKARKVKEQFVEMGVRALRAALIATTDRELLVKPSSETPVLMPAHVDLLSQTSPEPAYSPEPSVYLHGPEVGPADVQVLWRADLGLNPESWWDAVATCPPSSAEMLAVPLHAVKQWLTQAVADDIADIEGNSPENGKITGAMQSVLCWRGVDESWIVSKPEDVRPGMTLVGPVERGGCDEWGWSPDSKGEVQDIGDAVKLLMERPMLRLGPSLAKQWKYEKLAERLRATDQPAFGEASAENPPDAAAEPWVKEVVEQLQKTKRPRWISDPKDSERRMAVIGKSTFDQNDARSSYANSEIPLAEHLKNCGSKAREFGGGLPDELHRSVELAARMHDIGKADPRFQAWLRGGNPGRADALLAKSAGNGQNREAIRRARKLAGYPEGARHELASTAMLLERGKQSDDVDWDLVLHLVASHHGRCRPFAPVATDENPVMVKYDGVTASSAHGLDRIGSGVSERFWRMTRKYGWYGLAYLEAMVRLADQQVSEAEQSDQRKEAHA